MTLPVLMDQMEQEHLRWMQAMQDIISGEISPDTISRAKYAYLHGWIDIQRYEERVQLILQREQDAQP